MSKQLTIFGTVQEVKKICPLCQQPIEESVYLASVISDERVLYLANLVTHYRHNHVSWDDSWRYMQRRHPMWDYDKAKSIFNERAKRQYIRKAHEYLVSLGITADHFSQLQNTTEETLKVANRYL
jgi:hypothetical protein